MTGIDLPEFIRRGALRRRIRDPLIFGPIRDIPTVVATAPVVWLALLPTNGLDPQGAGTLTRSGVHLRWTFAPELPFPQNGFVAERRLYSIDEFLRARPRRWEVLPHGTLASAASLDTNALLARVSDGLRPATRAHFAHHIESFRQLLSQVASLPPEGTIKGEGTGAMTELRPLDLLHVAALEPGIARGLGVYLIDGSIRAGTPADYRVTGKWGNIPWPQRSVYLDALLSQRDVAAGGFFKLDWLTLFTSCSAVSDIGEDERGFIRLEGQAASELRLQFQYPVGEVELELAKPSTPGSWRIDSAKLGGRAVPVTLESSGDSLFVRAASVTDRFDDLKVRPVVATGTRALMHLCSVHVRRARGVVGNRISLVARATPAPNADIEEENVVFPLAGRVKSPTLAAVGARRVPPGLGVDGQVIVDRSSADLVCRPLELEASEQDSGRVVRLDVGHRRNATGSPEIRLTAGEPNSDVVEVFAHWSLESVRGIVRTPALTPVGGHAFSNSRRSFYPHADDGRASLELYTRSTGERVPTANPGFLEVELSRVPALNAGPSNVGRFGLPKELLVGLGQRAKWVSSPMLDQRQGALSRLGVSAGQRLVLSRSAVRRS